MNHWRHLLSKITLSFVIYPRRLPMVQRRTCGQLYTVALWLQKEWRVRVINEVHGAKTVR